MAFLVAKLQFSLTLLLVLISSLFLSSSHARDSQYFSKVTASNQQVEKIEEQESDGNPHGLYGASAAPPPPTTARPSEPLKRTPPSEPTSSSWRPDNYNPVAYVTPMAEEKSSVDHIPTLTREETHDSYTTASTTRNDEYDAVVENNYGNSQLQRTDDAVENNNENRHTTKNSKNNNDNNKKVDRAGAMFVERKGMSDTRYLANGKYFYDVENQVYSQNHPYEVLKTTNNYEVRPDAFTGYRSSSYNSENNYNSKEMNDQNEEVDHELFEQEDDSDMP